MNSIQTTQQLHQCIILANTTSSNNNSSANATTSTDTASTLLNNMCSEYYDGGSKLCTMLLREMYEQISMSSYSLYPITNENQPLIHVLFFTLTTIQRALTKDADNNSYSNNNNNDTIDDDENNGNGDSRKCVNESCRIELRYIIFHYMLDIMTTTTTNTTTTTTTNHHHHHHSQQNYKQKISHCTLLPKFLRTKVGIVLSLLIQADFPSRWCNAFQDIIQSLNFSQPLLDNNNTTATATATNLSHDVVMEIQRKDIFLRMIDAFCDEIIEKTHIERNIMIKDVVRGYAIGENCNNNNNNRISPEISISASIIETIFRIFQWSYPSINDDQSVNNNNNTTLGYHELQRLPIKAISVLKRLTPWVDLTLILNQNITSLFFSCLASAGPGDADDDDGSLSSQIAVQVIECLKEIMNKGMENSKKVSLIVNMKILERISACGLDLVKVDGTHISVVIKVAELLNIIGLELFTYWDNQCLEMTSYPDENEMTSVAAELNNLCYLFFYVFAYDDIDVSGAVVPLAVRMISTVEKEMKTKSKDLPFKATPHVSQVMSIMYRQMQYPPDFQYDYEDEDDAEEEIYRNELRKLNQALTRICPNENLRFICNILSEIELPLSSAPTPIIEAALRLVYHYCEGIRPIPGINVVIKNEAFREIIFSLHASDIMTHNHREVLLLYYDISVRYVKLLKERTEFLPNLLNSLTGSRGLQHEHCRVRSRSCYFLLKLVKELGILIRPFVEPAIRGILDLLSNQPTYVFNADDSLYLFETISLLLGKSGLDESNQQTYLTAVITPYVQQIQSTLNDPNLHKDTDHYGGILAYNIASLAFLSKGFTAKAPKEVQNVLLETVPIVLLILKTMTPYPPVRDKCMIYLQRMILCLNDKILGHLVGFIELLIQHCTVEDILDVAQLLNQICFKFQQNAVPCIDSSVKPFLEKCQLSILNLFVNVDEKNPPPHLVTEKHAILKIIYAFLNQVVSTNCSVVLLSPSNISYLEDILTIMGEGATIIRDPVMQKTCIQFFKELIGQWLSRDCDKLEVMRIKNGFEQYLFKHFLPGIISCFTCKDFDETDVNQYRLVREIAIVLSELKSSCSTISFEDWFLQECHVPSEIAQSFQLKKSPSDMEKILKAMIQTMKQ